MIGRYFRPGVHWIPFITAIYLPLVFLVTYGIAVLENDVSPGFPYISDAGATPPESCIFGQGLAIGAVICGLCIYIRFQHICHLGRHGKLNTAGLITGCIACIGLSVVGNFQETSVYVVHLIGAFMAFVVGVVYQWINTVIAFKVYPVLGSRGMCYVRAVLTVFSTCFAILAVVGDFAAHEQYHGNDAKHWSKDDGGYTMHILSTTSEWLMAFTFCCYFLTFCPEFHRLKIHNMTVSEEEMLEREEAQRLNV